MSAGAQKVPEILYILAEIDDFWSSRLPLALAAQAKGCIVHVAAPDARKDSKLKSYGFHGHNLPFSHRGFSILPAIKTIFCIHKLLKILKPSIVHTVTLKYSLLTGLAACCAGETRFVFTIAGLGYLFSENGTRPKILLAMVSPLLKKALRLPAAHITFQNSDDMEILVRGKFVRRESSALIRGSGVDLKKFASRGAPDAQTPLVLMPTRLVHDKGISVFIEMAEILEKCKILARFQVAGGLTTHNPLAITKAEMEAMVAGSPVEWLGKVADMPALYAAATLIVYPSWYREGIPRVLLESAAMGKAIVTTDHPGCRDAVIDGHNGLLVPVKNAEALANAVESLLKNPERRKVMEKNSRALAEKEFDVALITQQTLKIYGF